VRIPRVGDLWKLGKKKGRIGTIYMGWSSYRKRQVPFFWWERLPKGRYSGGSIRYLLEHGELVETREASERMSAAAFAKVMLRRRAQSNKPLKPTHARATKSS